MPNEPTTSHTGSVAGLQMLLFASLGSGMAMTGPRWLAPLLFLAGATWAVLLTLTGWLFTPSAPERRAVAGAYRALADMQAAVGTDDYEMRRQELTTALNGAYDTVLRDTPARRAISPMFIRVPPVSCAWTSCLGHGASRQRRTDSKPR